MAELPRGSSFLPTIKCSMCAADIEISRMGDHLCAERGDEPTTTPESHSNYDRPPMPTNRSPSNASGFLKPGRPGRAMPARVDTSAANRPFVQQEPLTPSSSSPPIGVSPATPNDRSRSPFARPLRSATAPMLRAAPPSPEPLSSNLDCAFPPFPTSKATKSKPKEKYAEADPMYAPVSPMTATSGGLLKRMNTISPGPFDVRRDGSKEVGSPPKERGHRRQATVGSNKDMIPESGEMGAGIQRPATTGSVHSWRSTQSSSSSRSDFALSKQPRENGYGAFGAPNAAEEAFTRPGLQPAQRSQTAPLRTVTPEPTLRRPSEPDTRMRRPSNTSEGLFANGRSTSRSPPGERKMSQSGPDRSRPLPPRGASLIRSRNDLRLGDDAPPVPTNVNLAAEFGIGNPYHAPSESQSSDTSGYSQDSKASSRSSPPSATRERRQPDDAAKLDTLMSEVQASMMDLQPKELPSSQSPPRKEQSARGLAPPRNLDPSLIAPESPMDPAIQSGRFSPIPARNPARNGESANPQKGKPPVRRPTTSKGNCKGCSEAIKGKSVSSADGRLTGRYHKQCFVCKTCSEPFATSTFYVINDAPYCESHYHKLNGSVCKTCDRGIEGQYLETAGKQKFHPKCLTCSDCNRSLTSSYFEMKGQVFCERDAFRRAQQGQFLGTGGPGAGTNRMERRTTRLMMM